jgi:glycosyltransferase involved in cell wall biosynthesis
MSTPAVTVVMAAFDTAGTVTSAVRSVLAQSAPDLELVVVDDGSTDGTPARAAEAAAGDPRVRVLERSHEGIAAARAAGIEAGSAPLVALIDSDDLWLPDYLERMRAALAAAPEAGWAYTDAWYLDEESRRVRRVSAMGYQRAPEPPPATADALFESLVERNFIFNAVTVRRSVIDAVGPPDRRLRSMIDWEWWLRMTAAGHHGVRVPGRLGVYRLRPASISRDPVRVAAGQAELWRLVAGEYDVPDALRARLRARAERFEAEAAMLSGGRTWARLTRSAKLRAIALRDAARARRDYYREPPEELRRAFGDLAGV